MISTDSGCTNSSSACVLTALSVLAAAGAAANAPTGRVDAIMHG
ncbi:hypothetical protein [Faecalibacterium langellae]|nr:hypothetical protein [Faecalibacterium prausnitzii]